MENGACYSLLLGPWCAGWSISSGVLDSLVALLGHLPSIANRIIKYKGNHGVPGCHSGVWGPGEPAVASTAGNFEV